MQVSTLADFFDAVAESRLLPAGRVVLLRQEFECGDATAINAAEQLIARELLTPWQAQRLLVGQTAFFLGKYKLLEKIGEGGMGAVFKAEQAPIGRVVAVKLLPQRVVKETGAVARFRREIQTAAALQHPNIVVAYDADSVRDTHFLVMEYVDGEDLAAMLKRRQRLPPGEACEYIRQAAIGLQHAFERGMAHRDIKPSNLMVESRGSRVEGGGTSGSRSSSGPQPSTLNLRPSIKILDFGLARFTSEFGDVGQITQTGEIVGTPDYISPEQAIDTRNADIRSDIYSLGCTLYRLLSGELPFHGRSVLEKLMSRVSRNPTPLKQHCPDLPPALIAVVHTMLARDPEQRYQTPAEVAVALAPFASANWETASARPATSVAVPSLQAGSAAALSADERALVLDDPTFPSDDGTVSFLASLANEVSLGSDTERTTDAVTQPTYWSGGASGRRTTITTPAPGEVHQASAAGIVAVREKAGGRSSLRLPAGIERRRRIERRRWVISFSVASLLVALFVGYLVYVQTGQTLLVIEWPEAERPRASLMVDGRQVPLPARGALEFPGTWGLRTIRATREGYEPVQQTLSLHRGETRTWAIPWKPLPQTARRLELAALQTDAAALLRRLGGQPPAPGEQGHLDLQRRIVGFRQQYAGTRECLEAAALAATIPCAADSLDPARVPAAEQLVLDRAAMDGLSGRIVAAFGDTRLRHVRPARSVGWTPDGHALVTAGDDATVRFWNTETGALVRLLTGATDGNPYDLAISPDGKLLACAGNTVRVTDLETSELRHDFPNEGHHFGSVAFSPDGRWLAGGSYKLVRVWDVTTGETVRSIESPNRTGVAFHPQDSTLAVVTQRIAQIWDVPGHQLLRQFDGDNYPAWSPDGGRLALSNGSGDVLILNSATGELQQTLPSHSQYCRSAFDPSGRIIAAPAGAVVRLWNAEDGIKLHDLSGHPGTVQSVAFSPDGTILAAVDMSGAVTLWDPVTGSRLVETEPSVTAGSVSPDGRYVAAGRQDGSVVLYDLLTATSLRTMAAHDRSVLAVAWHPDGRLVASGDEDGPIHIWDSATGQTAHQFTDPIRLESLTFSPDGRLLLAGQIPNSLSAWETKTWRQHDFPDPIPLLLTVAGFALDPAGDRLATASTQKQIDIWSIDLGQVIWHQEGLEIPTRMAFSPDNRTLAIAEPYRLGIWEISGREEPLVLRDGGGFLDVEFTPDGRRIVAGRYNGQVGTWPLSDGANPQWYFALNWMPNTQFRDLAVTADGRHIVCVPGNGAVYVIRTEDWPPQPGINR